MQSNICKTISNNYCQYLIKKECLGFIVTFLALSRFITGNHILSELILMSRCSWCICNLLYCHKLTQTHKRFCKTIVGINKQIYCCFISVFNWIFHQENTLFEPEIDLLYFSHILFRHICIPTTTLNFYTLSCYIS